MPYSDVTDLMFGSVPTPPGVESWLIVADEEIDAKVGHLYVTPLSFPDSTESRPGQLKIKRIAAMIATGRAIMSIDAGSQEDGVHQYAKYLLREAQQNLEAIACGDTILAGVQMLDPNLITSAPTVFNIDESSAVEDFYGNFRPAPLYQADPYWRRYGGL